MEITNTNKSEQENLITETNKEILKQVMDGFFPLCLKRSVCFAVKKVLLGQIGTYVFTALNYGFSFNSVTCTTYTILVMMGIVNCEQSTTIWMCTFLDWHILVKLISWNASDISQILPDISFWESKQNGKKKSIVRIVCICMTCHRCHLLHVI